MTTCLRDLLTCFYKSVFIKLDAWKYLSRLLLCLLDFSKEEEEEEEEEEKKA